MKDAGFEYLDHTADVQSRSWGRTLEEAIAQVALSLIATISPNLELIEPLVEKDIEISAEDKEALIFDFLSELLYIFDVERLLFSAVSIDKIREEGQRFILNATLKGEIFNSEKHEIGTEVKAITYSFMKIEEKDEKVEITMVFDI